MPENSTGSCGMMANLDRRSCSLMVLMSMPSTWIVPRRTVERKRKRARVKVDLPDPGKGLKSVTHE